MTLDRGAGGGCPSKGLRRCSGFFPPRAIAYFILFILFIYFAPPSPSPPYPKVGWTGRAPWIESNSISVKDETDGIKARARG